MEHTEVISATELEGYADTRESEDVIPELVWLLVNETVPDLTVCRIPYGDAINQPGWDGLVETATGFRQFVPKGRSCWEIGTGANPQKKATGAFRDRTKNMTPDELKSSTFVFVTARGPGSGGWSEPSQRAWTKKRQAKGWRHIEILDAIGLADWLREKPAIGKWLLKRIGLVKSSTGFTTPTEHWDNLKHLGGAGNPLMPSKVFLTGREQACLELQRVFRGEVAQLVLRVENELDAADFVAAYLESLPPDIRRPFCNKCLFVNDADAWHSVCHLRMAHVLVAHPKLDLESSGEQLHIAARNRGHVVILPVSAGGPTGSTEFIALRSPSVALLEAALVEGGYDPARARELASAGASSLGALKRHLRGLGALPPYATWESARELALAGLLGRWSGENPADRAAVESLLGKSYGEWIAIVRPETLRIDTPLTQRDENWKVISRGEAWSALGPRLANDDLDRFHELCALVLGERDPKLELPPEDRFAAGVYGKVLRHSDYLRKGLADALALLGARHTALSSCSSGKAELVAALTVRKLLKNADWFLWASLDAHLPLLAEAAPVEFLDAVEASLAVTPESPFHELFAQEGATWTISTYLAGLLWALETLAWHPDYLVRVGVLLAELASIDPGGMSGNRPANSLVDIFLPWHPQTCATVARRKAAVEAILHEQPDVGWKLLLALLPRFHGSTTGTRKPSWREFIPSGWSDRVTEREYWDQSTGYAELAVNSAATNLAKLGELIHRLPDLPDPASVRVLEHLSSNAVVGLPELDRQPLWDALVDLTAKHRKFADANWAMPLDAVAKIEQVAATLAPKSPGIAYRRLFSQRDFDLLEEGDDYEAQNRKLATRREQAVQEIFAVHQVAGVVTFAKAVASPEQVGLALGRLEPGPADSQILPAYLDDTDKAAFVAGFVWAKFSAKGWPWVDSIVDATWTDSQKSTFLAQLPFVPDTWVRAEQWLGDHVGSYWSKARVNPWQAREQLLGAIAQLLQTGRHDAALACMSWLIRHQVSFPPEWAIRALLEALPTEEHSGIPEHYDVTEIIKWLQGSAAADREALLRVEWAYLPLLEGPHGGRPKTLEARMAQDPGFFHGVVATVFRSKQDDTSRGSLTEKDRAVAQNAFRLLDGWTTVPGRMPDGSFDSAAFENWLGQVKQLASASGHLGSALNQIGGVLPYAPADPGGLWIHNTVAKALNAKDADDMRSGLTIRLFNMRGVHGYSAGKEEERLAADYRGKADSVEQSGYHRLATALRGLADGYERDAKREASRTPFED